MKRSYASLVSAFHLALNRLETARERVMNLEEVKIPDNTWIVIAVARRIKLTLKEAETARLGYAVDEMEKSIRGLVELEGRFMTSLCARDLMSERVDRLDPVAHLKFRKELERAFPKWNALREGREHTNLYQVREAYHDLLEVVKKAEASVEADRGVHTRVLQVA